MIKQSGEEDYAGSFAAHPSEPHLSQLRLNAERQANMGAMAAAVEE